MFGIFVNYLFRLRGRASYAIIASQCKALAIYGMAMIERMLYDELENAVTEIKYLLDKNPGYMKIVEEIKEKNIQKFIEMSEILTDFQNHIVIW